jgi:hypothetical protein
MKMSGWTESYVLRVSVVRTGKGQRVSCHRLKQAVEQGEAAVKQFGPRERVFDANIV